MSLTCRRTQFPAFADQKTILHPFSWHFPPHILSFYVSHSIRIHRNEPIDVTEERSQLTAGPLIVVFLLFLAAALCTPENSSSSRISPHFPLNPLHLIPLFRKIKTMSSLVPPQVLVDTPRPQKDGDKSDISIALNTFINNRPSMFHPGDISHFLYFVLLRLVCMFVFPESPRSPRQKHCSLQATKTITRAKSPVPPSK